LSRLAARAIGSIFVPLRTWLCSSWQDCNGRHFDQRHMIYSPRSWPAATHRPRL